MLVDIAIKQYPSNEIREIEINHPTFLYVNNIERGFYEIKHHNPSFVIDNSVNFEEFNCDVIESLKIKNLSSCGVCDSPEQFIRRYKNILQNSKYKFAVFFTIVLKSEQSSWGGWRWHKWGEYIGDKNPKHEYLYDEDDSITQATCYSILTI